MLPLHGSWLKQCFIYKAEIHVENDYKINYGAVEGEFKFDIITTHNPLKIGIINLILNFKNEYGN